MIQCHFSCDTKRRQIKEIEKIAFDNIDRLEASSASYPRNTGLKVYGSTSGWFLSSRFLFYFEISPLCLVLLFSSSCVFFRHLFLILSLVWWYKAFVLPRVFFAVSSISLRVCLSSPHDATPYSPPVPPVGMFLCFPSLSFYLICN